MKKNLGKAILGVLTALAALVATLMGGCSAQMTSEKLNADVVITNPLGGEATAKPLGKGEALDPAKPPILPLTDQVVK